MTYNILIFTKVFKTRQVYLKLFPIEKFTLLECHIQHYENTYQSTQTEDTEPTSMAG